MEAQGRLKAASGDIKPVEAENLHFTIKFIGETGKAEEIKGAMESACKGIKPFEIGIAGINAFPGKDYARTIWLRVKEGSREFESLIKAVDEMVARIGFEKERSHIPHLTIARVRSGGSKPGLLRFLERYQAEIGRMRVEEVKLMKSTLTGAGPIYEEIFGVKLE